MWMEKGVHGMGWHGMEWGEECFDRLRDPCLVLFAEIPRARARAGEEGSGITGIACILKIL